MVVLKEFLVLQFSKPWFCCPPPPDFDCWHLLGSLSLILLLFFAKQVQAASFCHFLYGIQNFLLVTCVTIIYILPLLLSFLEPRYALFILFPHCVTIVSGMGSTIYFFFPSQLEAPLSPVSFIFFPQDECSILCCWVRKTVCLGQLCLMKQHSQAVVKISSFTTNGNWITALRN